MSYLDKLAGGQEPPKKTIYESLLENKKINGASELQLGQFGVGESKYDTNITPLNVENLEYLRGEQQNGFAQLGLGVVRATLKAGIEMAKSPVYLYALGESLLPGTDINEALDNSILKALENVEESYKEAMPVYQSYKSGKGGILDAISSTAFWASDGADGVGYLFGMIGSGYALKGIGMASKLSKLGIGAELASNVELGTQTLLNTFIESAAEAKGVVDNLKRQGVTDPELLANAGRETLYGNFGVLLLPNLIMNKALLGTGKVGNEALNRFKDSAGNLMSKPMARKTALEYAKKAGIGMFSEGFIEEGSQTSIENYEINKALGKTDEDFITGVANEYLNTLTTTQGQKSILLGAVLGSLGNVAGQYKQNKYEDKLAPKISELIEKNFDGFAIDNDIFHRDEDGTIIYENNKPKVDMKKALTAFYNLANEFKQSTIMDYTALTDNQLLHDYTAHNSFARFAVPFFQMGDIGIEILQSHLDKAEQTKHLFNEEKLARSQDNSFDKALYLSDLKRNSKDLAKIYNSTLETAGKLRALDQLEVPEGKQELAEEYRNKITNQLYYETVKQHFIKDKLGKLHLELVKNETDTFKGLPQGEENVKEYADKINDLNKVFEKSVNDYKELLNSDNIKNGFQDYIKSDEKLDETIKQAEQKVAKEEQKQEEEDKITKPVDDLFNKAMSTNDANEFNSMYDEVNALADLTVEQKNKLRGKKAAFDLLSSEPELDDETTEQTDTETQETEDTNDEDQEVVSKQLTEATTANETEKSQGDIIDSTNTINVDDGGKYFGGKSDVVMMHLFNHRIVEVNGKRRFYFLYDKNGYPEYENNSKVDITELNKIQKGDTVSFHLVELNDEQIKDFKIPPDYDGYHIAIKSNGKLIGFVPQPHEVDPEWINEEGKAALEQRSQLIDFRRAVTTKLKEGKSVTEEVFSKSPGNLYAKYQYKNNSFYIDPINNIFTDFRNKDMIGDLLTFAYADKDGKIQIKQGDLTNKEYKKLMDSLAKYNFARFKPGRVFQVVKDTANGWSVIPVYANKINDYTAQLIVGKLMEYDDNSQLDELAKALDGYIFTSFKNNRVPLFISKVNNEITLTTGGKTFSLNDINNDTNDSIEEFMKALKTNRQNINVTNINNTVTQEQLKERNTLVTNVTQTNEGEYFVQPKITYSQNIFKPEVTQTTNEQLESPQIGTSDTKQENSIAKLKELLASKKDEEDDDYAYSTTKDDTKLDEKRFQKFLATKLPQLSLADRQVVEQLKTNMVDTFGLYKDLTIYLFEGAGSKTAYHEAFHGVFRNLLSYNEKIAVLNEAMNKYEQPTLEQLQKLGEVYNNEYSIKQLKYLYYEEKLADDFADFTYKYNDKTWITKISRAISDFFNKILSLFNIFTSNESSVIDTLFKNVNKGEFKSRKTVSNSNVEVFNRELAHLDYEYAYSRNLKGIFKTPTIESRTIQSIGNKYMSIYQDNYNSNKSTKPTEIFKQLFAIYHNVVDKVDETFTKTELQTLVAILENKDKIVKEVEKYLSLRSVKINLQLNTNDETSTLAEDEDDVDEYKSEETGINRGFRDATSMDGLSSASKRLKIFLSSIPVLENGKEKTDKFGITQYVDFSSLYYYIERNLTGIFDLKSQILELDELSNKRPELKQVISKLGFEVYEDESINNIDQRSIREIPVNNVDESKLELIKNDFKTNFSKQQLAYTLAQFTINKNNGTIDFKIFDANRKDLRTELFTKFKNNLLDSTKNTISEYDDEKGEMNPYGTTKAIKLAEVIQNMSNKPSLNQINNILLQLGIELSDETIKGILQNETDYITFKTNLNDYINGYVKVPYDAYGRQQTQALRELVKFEVNTMMNSYTSSFNDSENKNIYTIQLPSFAAKTLAKITNNDRNVFNNWMSEMLKDPYYKHSNLLAEFKADATFRKEQFKLSYLDGLKNRYGDSGRNSKFTSLNDKDFAILSIALFQNTAVNRKGQGGKLKSNTIGKYIYITPSDKTMAMLFDSKVYEANWEMEGKQIKIKRTGIVNQYYNVFLQEASRIKNAIDFKNEVLETRDEAKLRKVLQYYHLSKKSMAELDTLLIDPEISDVWSKVSDLFDGQAFGIENFVDLRNNKELVGKIKAKLESLPKGANIEEAMDEFKTSVLTDITKELTGEVRKTIDEMLEKGVIKHNESGLYEPVGIQISTPLMIQGSELDLKQNKEQRHREIQQLMADFSLNTMLMNIELSNIFNGDKAQYKPGDLQKRTYQSQSSITNNNFKNKVINTRVVKDYETQSQTIDSLVSILRKNFNMTDVQIKDLGLDGYYGINVTDAQVYITPEFFKSILQSRGIWNDDYQNAYDILEDKKSGDIAESLRMLIAAIKPFYYGSRFDEALGIQRFEQVKCAMLPLFKKYTDINPLLAQKRQEMINDGIDMLAHESSFKASIGVRNSITDSKGEILQLNSDNFGIQVDNPIHGMDEENDSMRQLKMLMIGSIDPNKSYGPLKMSGRQIIDNILSMEAANINEAWETISKKLDVKNNANFSQFIKEMVTKRGATTNIEEIFSIKEGEFEYPLDNGLTSTQVENLISSIITNNVIKQSFAGDARVQATSLGVNYKTLGEQEDNLTDEARLLRQELQWIKPNAETGQIEYAECIMPAWTEKFFNENGTLKDINTIPANLREMIVYRIPTEGLHSMLPIRVVKFLPETMGNFILLPYEVTAQMGADFDFDKLFFIRKEFFSDTKDGVNVDLVEYNYIADEDKVNERYFQYLKYTSINNLQQLSKEEFAELPVDLQNVKPARNNHIIDNYLTLLTAFENTHLLIKPSGFAKLLGIKKQYFSTPKGAIKNSNFFSSRVQRDYKSRNHTGIALKGQVALHVSGHSYATLMDLRSDRYEINKGKSKLITASAINFNGENRFEFNKLYTDDGSLIADEVSSAMAAVLDDIKDPIIALLGVDKNTVDVFCTIVRAGYNIDLAAKFVAQLGIKEMSKLLTLNSAKFKDRKQGTYTVDGVINDYQDRLDELLSKLATNGKIDEKLAKLVESKNVLNINIDELESNLEKYQDFKDDVDKANLYDKASYYAFQLRVLNAYKNMELIAKALVDVNKFFGINKQVGPNMEDILAKQELYYAIKKSTILKGFDLSKIPTLQATFNVHLKSIDYLGNYFPYATDYYMGIKKDLFELQTDKTLDKVPVEDRMWVNGFVRYFNSNLKGYFKDLHSEYDNLFVSLPKLLDDIKNISLSETKYNNGPSYEYLRKNLFIKNIETTFDKKQSDKHFVIMKANRLDIQVKNQIIDAFDALYKDGKTRDLAIDLIKHAFASNGFFSGLNSYASYINPEILKELGYMDERKAEIKLLKQRPKLASKATLHLLRQLIRNNPKPFTKVFDPEVFGITDGKLPSMISTNMETLIKYNKEKDFRIANDEHGPMWIRLFDATLSEAAIYELVDKGSEFTYQRINPVGIKGFSIEVKPFDELDISYFSSNNVGSKESKQESNNESEHLIEAEKPALNYEFSDDYTTSDEQESKDKNKTKQSSDEPGEINNECK